MERSSTIPIAIIAGGIIVAGAIYLSMAKAPAAGTGAGNPALVRPVGASDHILGNPGANVMIVEYSDFNCEFCKGFNDTLHQIIATEGANGSVAWVFREFPLSEIHPTALSHARAAECAGAIGGNDAFWKFADLLFANQPADTTQYGAFAKSAGVLGADAFATCYANASTTDIGARISADRQNALLMGARGTPYSVILTPGRPPIVMDGAYSYDAVKQLVDQALTPN